MEKRVRGKLIESSFKSIYMAANSAPFSRLRTAGFAGYNLAWSPFYPDKLAIAGSANVSLMFDLMNVLLIPKMTSVWIGR